MTNSEYLKKLKGLIEVYEHFGGEPGTGTRRVDLLLVQLAADPTSPTKAERSAAIQQARDTYLATLLLVKSDAKRYGALLADIENEHTRGVDAYPVTLSTAYDMLTNYRVPPNTRFHPQDGGISFYTDGQ